MKLSEISLKSQEKEINLESRATPHIPDELSPYTIYTILKNIFGEPNSDFDETRSQWAYELQVPGAIIEIYDWKLVRVSVHVYADSGFPEESLRIGEEFIEILKNQSKQYSGQIKKMVENANSFILQNPFALYYQSATRIVETIKHATLTELKVGSVQNRNLELNDLCRSAFFLFIASFEGFLNMIYELYLKPELKDPRIYDRLSRDQIDIKLRLSPVYCSCFKNELIDNESDSFRKFHSIVNLRNDFIHANLTKSMKIPVVSDNDKQIIHFPNTRDKFGLPRNIDELTKEDLQFVKESIDEMVGIVLQDMILRYQKEFQKVMYKKYVLIEIENGEVVVLEADDYIG